MNYSSVKNVGALRRVLPTFTQANILVWLCIYAGAALAVDNNAAPWDGPLCGVAGWFKGTTPIAIGTIAFAAAAAGFFWGEELTGMLKKLVNLVIALSIMIGGASFVGWIAVKLGAGAAMCTG